MAEHVLNIYFDTDDITPDKAHDRLYQWCPGRHHWWQFWRKKGCPFLIATSGPVEEGDSE